MSGVSERQTFVRDGCFVKCYAADEFAEVRHKYARLASLGSRKSIVLVTPVAEDSVARTLAFPHVRDLQPIHKLLFGAHGRRAGEAEQVLDLCADALALIHSAPLEGQALPPWSHPSIQPSAADGPPVLLHGDFGFSNLFVVRERARGGVPHLVVIDAEASRYFSSRHLQAGPRYADLALMTSCLLGRLGALRSLFVARRLSEHYVREFARRYEMHSGVEVLRPKLRQYTQACVRSYFTHRFESSLLGHAASQILLNRFHELREAP